jgi:hypothetical protein
VCWRRDRHALEPLFSNYQEIIPKKIALLDEPAVAPDKDKTLAPFGGEGRVRGNFTRLTQPCVTADARQ